MAERDASPPDRDVRSSDSESGGSARAGRPSWRRRAAVVAALVAVCLGVVATRAVWEGTAALREGDAAHRAGDDDRAIARWRRAARWYLPGAPHVGDAYDRLEALARAAEERGDIPTALAAWRGVRGSILSTRSFYTPHEDRLDPANRRIAALMAQIEGAAADPGRSEPERAEWHYALLARDESPSVAWSVIALLGLAMWIAGALWFALRGVTDDDRLVARTAASAGALIAAGLVVWLLGLYRA